MGQSMTTEARAARRGSTGIEAAERDEAAGATTDAGGTEPERIGPRRREALERRAERARRRAERAERAGGGVLKPVMLRGNEARGRGEAPTEEPVQAPPAPATPVAAPAATASRRPRHLVLIAAFLAVVLGPTGLAAVYLYTRAVDQYASEMGFAVHSEDTSSAFAELGLPGAILGGGNTSATDTDFLYEYIQGQQIVESVDAELDLRAIYTRHHERDPWFSLAPEATIEELTAHWQRMVTLDYDSGTGLIKVRVLAPSAADAHAIGEAILERSSQAVNALDTIARADKMEAAERDLEAAVEGLTEARQALAAFRTRTQMIDPAADLQGQMGLLTNLQLQQAEALIELDLLRQSAGPADPRIEQIELRLDVIEGRIAEERDELTVSRGGDGREDYVAIIGEYERLAMNKEFAQTSYVSALAAHEAARAEAARQSRYLASYQPPTRPQMAEHPARMQMVLLTAVFSLLTWAVAALVFYSVRDRR